MRKTTFLITIAGVALAAACSAPPAETPAPGLTEAEVGLSPPTQDSLDAEKRANADSLVRVRSLTANAARRAAAAVAMKRAGIEKTAKLEKSAELKRELRVMVHFDAAQAQIQPEGRATLDRKVAILNANPTVRLRITGACDERGSDQYNHALGYRRAAAVKQYLVAKGIDGSRLDERSFGEQSPIDSGRGAVAWARNRRAEFMIVSDDMPLAMRR